MSMESAPKDVNLDLKRRCVIQVCNATTSEINVTCLLGLKKKPSLLIVISI